MKKIVVLTVLFIFVTAGAMLFASCAISEQPKLSGSVTVREWLDKKGEGNDFTVTVTVVELVNPYYARVEDATGSVLLYGLWENGEPKAFAEKDVDVGDTIVVKNPVYNIFEGNVEMKEGTLAEKR